MEPGSAPAERDREAEPPPRPAPAEAESTPERLLEQAAADEVAKLLLGERDAGGAIARGRGAGAAGGERVRRAGREDHMSGIIRAARLREPVVLLRSQERPAHAHAADAQVKAAPAAEPAAPKISYDEYEQRFHDELE